MRQGITVFALSGHMNAEQVAELKKLFDTEYRSIILDLQELRLADRDAVRFLTSCERDGLKLENCPEYVREWMDREEEIREPRTEKPNLREEVNRNDEYIFFGAVRCRCG